MDSTILDSTILDSAILGSPMVTIPAEVTLVTVPVTMVTAWLPWKYRAFCIKVPSFDHVTHLIGLGDLLWLMQNPYISILLTFLSFAL